MRRPKSHPRDSRLHHLAMACTISSMEEIIAIDGSGRLVIPARLRRKLHLVSGVRLRVVEDGPRLILEPVGEDSPTRERGGLLVLCSKLLDVELDHRDVREERLDKMARGR